MNDTRFGAELARQRTAAHMSQGQLGALAGMDSSYISRLEMAKREPSRDTVAALAALVSADWAATCQLFVCAGYLPPGPWVAIDGWLIKPREEATNGVRPEPTHDESEGQKLSPGGGAAGVVA